MEKLRMAIIGACYSRDLFNSKIFPDYKKYFKPVFHQNQISMISLASEAYRENDELFVDSKLSPFAKQQIRSELSKSFWNSLILGQPDYLIIDFYGDAMFGAVKYKNTWLTNKTSILKQSCIYGKLDEEINFFNNPDVYLEKWQSGVKRLLSFLDKYLPNTKLILNPKKLEDSYFDDKNEMASLKNYLGDEDFEIDDINNLLDTFNQVFIHLCPKAKVLSFEKRYYLNLNRIWGPWYLHFQDDYYTDFNDQLLTTVIEDYRIKNSNLHYSPKKMDLLENMRNRDSFLAWSFKSPYYVSVEGQLQFNCPHLKEDFVANWTQGIQLASTNLSFMFCCKVFVEKGMSEENIIFSFREFRNSEQVQAKDALSHQNIKLKDLTNYKVNRWFEVKLNLTFKQSNFLKIGFSSKESGVIKWKNPKLIVKNQLLNS